MRLCEGRGRRAARERDTRERGLRGTESGARERLSLERELGSRGARALQGQSQTGKSKRDCTFGLVQPELARIVGILRKSRFERFLRAPFKLRITPAAHVDDRGDEIQGFEGGKSALK